MITLRQHQHDATAALLTAPHRKAIAEVTVAGGKSLIMARTAQVEGLRSLILAHSDSLVRQNLAAAKSLGVRAVPCCNGVGISTHGHVTVGTIGSVLNRVKQFRDVQRIIVDEVHMVPPETTSRYQQLFAALPHAACSGVTGTPFRAGANGDEKLQKAFGPVVYRYSFADALRDEYVKPLRLVETDAASIDTSGVRVRQGEFDTTQLSHRGIALAPVHAAAAVQALREEGRTRTIVFACDVAHADALAQAFTACGLRAIAVHYRTKNPDAAIAAFRAGAIDVMVSAVKFSVGFDCPDIDSVVLARPVKSLVYYVQSLGRGARLTPFAPDCVVVDYGGNVDRHGPLDMVRVPKKRERDPNESRVCKRCLQLYAPFLGLTCPHCGHYNGSASGDGGGDGREIGKDLSEHAQGGRLLSTVPEAKWYPITGAPKRFVRRDGRAMWTVPTKAGAAKWWSAFFPNNAVHAFVRFDQRYGLTADGVIDQAQQFYQAS